jgi:hypothetical protein
MPKDAEVKSARPYQTELPGIGKPDPGPFLVKPVAMPKPDPSPGIDNPAVRKLCLSFFTGMSKPTPYFGMRRLERCLDRMEMKHGY